MTLSFLAEPSSGNGADSAGCYVYYNSAQVGYTSSYRKIFQLLEWQITWCADEVAKFFLLQVGAVSKDGVGIVLPGASKSGKSCLTVALVREGYQYFSDEIAAIDPSTRELHPFPRAVGIRDSSVFPDLASRDDLLVGPAPDDPDPVWFAHPKDVMTKPLTRLRPHITPVRYMHIDDIASTGSGASVPIRYVIFPKYDPTSNPELQPLTPAKALTELIKASRNHSRFGNDALHILAPLVQGAQFYSLRSNDVRSSVALINDLVGA